MSGTDRTTLQITTDHREIHARTFALSKARDVAGEIVQLVLDRSEATIPNLDLIEVAEQHIARRIAGLLKHSVIEFVDMYAKDLEERNEALQRMVEDGCKHLQAVPQPLRIGDKL